MGSGGDLYTRLAVVVACAELVYDVCLTRSVKFPLISLTNFCTRLLLEAAAFTSCITSVLEYTFERVVVTELVRGEFGTFRSAYRATEQACWATGTQH